MSVNSVYQLANENIVSESWDKTIKIWNPETGKVIINYKLC